MLYSQIGVARARLPVHPAILQLREVALKEADLMLVCGTRDVRCRPLDGEMVVHGTLVDRGLGLRDQLSPPHVTVPFCRAIDRDLSTLFATDIARVLVIGRKVDVFGDGAGTVDVVLVVCKRRTSIQWGAHVGMHLDTHYQLGLPSSTFLGQPMSSSR